MRFNSTIKRSIDIIVPAAGVGWIAWQYIGKKQDRDIRYVLFVMALVGIALYAITSSLTKIALTKALSGLKPADQETIIVKNNIDKSAYDRIEMIAKNIYGAFHDSSWTEDEDKAINALNGLSTPGEVKTLCEIYLKLYSLSVKTEFDTYVTFADLFVNPLKPVITESWF